MIFGRIDYINLLPFHLFMKRFLRSNAMKMALHYKRGVPSKVNKAFKARRVDAAFISSIAAQKARHCGLGIIANKEVRSVLLIPRDGFREDTASQSSNALARILGLQGQVIIGDPALAYYLGGGPAIDMAAAWYAKERLPFVFALLSFHKHARLLSKMERRFLRYPTKIPQYQLHRVARRTDIPPEAIRAYLKLIHYDVNAKARTSVRRFWRQSRLKRYAK